jgi:hypothetical protein
VATLSFHYLCLTVAVVVELCAIKCHSNNAPLPPSPSSHWQEDNTATHTFWHCFQVGNMLLNRDTYKDKAGIDCVVCVILFRGIYQFIRVSGEGQYRKVF